MLNITRKILSIIFVIFLFTACSSQKQQASETFLDTTDDETLLRICQDIHILRYGREMDFNEDIKSVSDITQSAMYTYFLCVADIEDVNEEYFNSETNSYKFPVDLVQDCVNKHFVDFTVEPNKFEEFSFGKYDSTTDKLEVFAFPSPNTGFPEIGEKKAVSDDTIEISVNYLDRYDDIDSALIYETELITIKIVENDWQFVSLTITEY